jgi:hypothetical protein
MEIFKTSKWDEKISPERVAKAMNSVCQKNMTAHSFVFEPATLKLKLAFGDGKQSATEFALKEIDLKSLFANP